MSRHTAQILRFADLPNSQPTAFQLEPNAETCAQLAQELELLGLRKLRLTGELRPVGKQDWELTATLGATVVQACVATLEPVTTRIDAPLRRLYVAEYTEPEAPEIEMPEDDTVEALPGELDLGELTIEALSLALPLYPRADGAEAVTVQVTEPGKTAMTDEDARPFAGLAALKDKLSDEES